MTSEQKKFLIFVSLGFGLISFGSNSAYCKSINEKELIGEYHFVSHSGGNDGKRHEGDELLIKKDGSYSFKRGTRKEASITKSEYENDPLIRLDILPGEEKIGKWSFTSDNGVTEILIDHAGYPVHQSSNEIQLLINEDLGQLWVKKEK